MGVVVLCAAVFSSCDKTLGELFPDSEEALVVSPLAHQLGFTKDRPLVMGMNTSYAPLQYVDENGVPSGYDVEFTKKLMRRMGIPFTLTPNHWDKMSPGIIGGEYDMGMLVYSHYRKDETNYSDAVFRLYYQIVYRKQDYTNFDFRHLRGRKIAYMKSRPIGLMLKDEGAEDVPITDLSVAFTDLAKGDYDGVICYRFQARYNIGQLHMEDQLQAEDLSLEPREYCYASANKQLIDAVNAELKRMEAEGIIDEVYGQEVAERFGVIKIPAWVWGLLVLLTFLFLIVFSVNRYRLSRKLQVANRRLQLAFDQLSKQNEELSLANERAKESTRMKSAFIRQISHEIRTPLNVLGGFVQLLTTPGLQMSEAEQADASHQILESTDRITGLVNKMLELSDVSSQAVLDRNDESSAESVAREAVLVSGIGDAAHLTFELKLEAGADTPFKTHREAAVRIVELLLDNAMKFTHPAEAYMHLGSQTADPEKKERVTLTVGTSDGVARFVVEDTGIGVPEAEAEHIFDEFVQLDEYYDGTGIGLAIARSLARRLGGDVVLDTSYGSENGARFVFTLSA